MQYGTVCVLEVCTGRAGLGRAWNIFQRAGPGFLGWRGGPGLTKISKLFSLKICFQNIQIGLFHLKSSVLALYGPGWAGPWKLTWRARPGKIADGPGPGLKIFWRAGPGLAAEIASRAHL